MSLLYNYCSNCGNLFHQNDSFCPNCGNNRKKIDEQYTKTFCSECGTALGEFAKYCGTCGRRTGIESTIVHDKSGEITKKQIALENEKNSVPRRLLRISGGVIGAYIASILFIIFLVFILIIL